MSSHSAAVGFGGAQGYFPYNFGMYPGATGAMFPGAKVDCSEMNVSC